MQPANLLLLTLVLALVAYGLGYARSRSLAMPLGGIRHLKSLPFYYGARAALWCGIPALLVLAMWAMFQAKVIALLVVGSLPVELLPASDGEASLLMSKIANVASGALPPGFAEAPVLEASKRLTALQQQSRLYMTVLVIAVAILAGFLGWVRIRPRVNARTQVEAIVKWVFFACAAVAILTTMGIIFSVAFETFRFFQQVSFWDFIFGSRWSPQTALRMDQVAAEGAFGMIPLFTGTLLISAIAMIVAVPVGLMSAIYLSEYASRRMRSVVKPLLEMLAGIPTVVYGFFAALTVAPAISNLAAGMGISASSQSALAAGSVMGIMIIPFVSSLSDDVINAVPRSLRDGSLALGATQSETMTKVIFPAALPGIMGGILLAVSRAIGETMIVVMAAGLAANLTANPLETVTTVTVQIVTLLTGDQEFDSAKTLAAFALGAMLFLCTLLLNVIALKIVRKYREQYD